MQKLQKRICAIVFGRRDRSRRIFQCESALLFFLIEQIIIIVQWLGMPCASYYLSRLFCIGQLFAHVQQSLPVCVYHVLAAPIQCYLFIHSQPGTLLRYQSKTNTPTDPPSTGDDCTQVNNKILLFFKNCSIACISNVE